jgi:hypothetical protein
LGGRCILGATELGTWAGIGLKPSSVIFSMIICALIAFRYSTCFLDLFC